MIVLAADYVGHKIVEYLINSNESISFLVLDTKDRGGYNGKIKDMYCSAYSKKTLHYQESLSDDKFLDKVKALNLNLGLLAWWPYILKGKILSIPKIGWLNFHPSYLPYNRGKHSSFWCLVDETDCGVSLQFIDEGIDTGDIVASKRIKVSWTDTGKTIYDRCREEIIDLFKKNFKDIKQNKVNRIKQKPNEGTYHKSSEITDIVKIDLDANYQARKLFNIIRGKISPPAYFYDNQKKYNVEIKIKEVKDEN